MNKVCVMHNVSASRRKTFPGPSFNMLGENLILTEVPILWNKDYGLRLKQSGSAVNAAIPAVMRNCSSEVAVRVVG